MFDFEHTIAANHRAGLYWYHPSFHGLFSELVSGDLAEAIHRRNMQGTVVNQTC